MSLQDLYEASIVRRKRILLQNMSQAYEYDGLEGVLKYMNGCLSKQVARDKAQQVEIEPHTVRLLEGTISVPDVHVVSAALQRVIAAYDLNTGALEEEGNLYDAILEAEEVLAACPPIQVS